ncbi:MAG: hypothetical protein EB141_02490, partial [Verrucomicrobia bacterium]|nr:hypothetical protein [Verrucomicrobiota bacterium]
RHFRVDGNRQGNSRQQGEGTPDQTRPHAGQHLADAINHPGGSGGRGFNSPHVARHDRNFKAALDSGAESRAFIAGFSAGFKCNLDAVIPLPGKITCRPGATLSLAEV